jgi:hypothetical protein
MGKLDYRGRLLEFVNLSFEIESCSGFYIIAINPLSEILDIQDRDNASRSALSWLNFRADFRSQDAYTAVPVHKLNFEHISITSLYVPQVCSSRRNRQSINNQSSYLSSENFTI